MIVTERNTGEEKILIRGADTDRFNDASIPFFFSICQDAGGFHAGLFGFSAEELMGKHNWTWMILRSRIRFHKIPHLGDTIKVETWAQPSFHLFFPRVINGYTDNGEPVFEAMTHWVLFDIARKRPLRPSTLDFPIPDESIRKDPKLGKMPDWDDVKKLEILPSYAPECSYYDVDLNKHINNVGSTGRLSPVTADWSKKACPSAMTPSTATDSPCRTTMRSPIFLSRKSTLFFSLFRSSSSE